MLIRSFFTSVGKIVTAFEDRSLLDPVVTRFGRLVTSLREDDYFVRETRNSLLKTVEKLIGGNIESKNGRQYLSTEDGRIVPFSALSSGQQELLPLLYALRFSLVRDQSVLLYIEEPEAHLFPSAQTELVDMFAQMVSAPSKRNSKSPKHQIVLTTHSPYVLAKINNLVKAGQLGQKLPADLRRRLEKIISPLSWIAENKVAAYAIHDRRLVSIVDDMGLIDGDYIDNVSAQTGVEFDQMLDLESAL